jgi:Cu(I)/Ag(I) efflux system membrane fusion protein
MASAKKIVIPILIALFSVAVVSGGYYLWQQKWIIPAWPQQTGQQAVQYTCPMHPFIIKDRPGNCPICGMTLVKKAPGAQVATQADAKADAKKMADMEEVSLSPTQMVLANVANAEAKLTPFFREINAVGIVTYDQARQAKVTSWVSGRIDRLNVNKVGDYVSTKRPVAEIYSPDLVSSQEEYLLAIRSRDQLKDSPIAAISQGGEGLVASARERLKLFGVKDWQIEALEKAGRPNIRLPIYTPLSGIVIDKLVQEGQYVNVGEPLFNIADLSTVWVEMEVYENEFPFLKIGQKADIVSQSFPGETFRGRISYIYPFLDPKTRTVKARVEIHNPGLKLKPDMFVNVSVKASLGEALVIPVTAVMDTGKRKVVWVEVDHGRYMPHDIETGARTGDYVQVISGLKEGDKVASSGGYLIDSEAQLRSGGGQGAMPGMKMPGDDKGASAPAPKSKPNPKNGDLNMNDMKM